jgi:inosine triphosphate pyrophosphatase
MKQLTVRLPHLYPRFSKCSEVPEWQGSIEEIAKAKCRQAFDRLQRPVITEDTCLVFDAFGADLPGPYIKWFLQSLGTTGIKIL